jgi:hypothetical protein
MIEALNTDLGWFGVHEQFLLREAPDRAAYL